MTAYFDASKMPTPVDEYVCFIDIMGMQTRMAQSINQASNFIYKLHATLLEAWRNAGYSSISIYPIMDGAYITSRNKNDLLNLLTVTFNNLATALSHEVQYSHWYLVRASIAFGPAIHGRNVPYDACLEFSSRVGYKEQLLISPAMIEAYLGERDAAPMGVNICNSANKKRQGIDGEWKWYKNPNIKTQQDMLSGFTTKLQNYLLWLGTNSSDEQYKPDRRKAHADAARNYFNIREGES